MQMIVHGIKPAKNTQEMLSKRLSKVLQRYGSRVMKMDVYLSDVNGPKGGKDKSARITAQLNSGKTVTAEGRRDNLYAAIAQATTAINASIKRAVRTKQVIKKQLGRKIRQTHDALSTNERRLQMYEEH